MNEEEQQKALTNSQLQQQSATALATTAQQQQIYQEMEKGLAEEQLDVDGIIFSLFNLLCGNQISFNSDGRREWKKNDNKSLRVLSDDGIQRVMQCIISYVNKLKMLSNHNDEEIRKAMYDFTTELNDNVLMRYEDMFYCPSFKECKDILEEKIKERVELKKYSSEILGEKKGKDFDEEVRKEMEHRIEYEIEKIRVTERKKRIKEYGMLTLIIEHQILDTYRRSEGGKERETLRRHANFTEIRAVGETQQNKGGPFSWLKR